MSLEELNASIDKIVAEVWMIEPHELMRRTRLRHIAEPRQVAIYIRVTVFHNKEAQAAMYYKLNSSTVYHAVRTVAELTRTNRIFRDRLNLVMQKAELVKKIYFDGK